MSDTGQFSGFAARHPSQPGTCQAALGGRHLPRFESLACHHGLLRNCAYCDTPIPFALTPLARLELNESRIERWHRDLHAEADSPGPSAHLRGEA